MIDRSNTSESSVQGRQTTASPDREALAGLLHSWLDAASWVESREMLKNNARRLLSDDAVGLLTSMIVTSTSEDTASVLQRHLALLQEARESSIDHAYADLLKPVRELTQVLLLAESAEQRQLLVSQSPLLLEEDTLRALEAMAVVLERDGDTVEAQRLRERLLELRDLRQKIQILVTFANVAWVKRRELLNQYPDVLLHESVDRLLDALLAQGAEAKTIERLRTLLRRCRTWGVQPVIYFELSMHLSDDITIPAPFEATIMSSAALLWQRRKQEGAPEQAVEQLQRLLDRLTAQYPPLFEAALLRDVADARRALPRGHPGRQLELIVSYYREALPVYQAEQRHISVAFIHRAIGEVLCELGRYEDALEPLNAAIEDFCAYGRYKNDIAWTLSSRASALDGIGRVDEALSDFTEAIKLLPSVAPLYRNRAETLIHAQRLDEAEADLQRAVALDRNEESVLLWYRRAQLALARGNSMLAIRMLDEVIERDPTYDIAFLQAQCEWLLGDVEAAYEKLQELFARATPGERAVMQRELDRLKNAHPDLEPIL